MNWIVRNPQLVKKVSIAFPLEVTTVLILYNVGSSRVHKTGLFTANENLFLRTVGQLGAERHAQVVRFVVNLIQAGA